MFTIIISIIIFAFFRSTVAVLYDIRVGEVQLYHDSKYIPGYHLHTIGTYSSATLFDCIYLCQNNDYCRTANYFNSNMGTLCSLFEENSFVGEIISFTSTMSIVISFNLCPNDFMEPTHICFGLPANTQPPAAVQYVMNHLRFVQQWSILIYYPIILTNLLYVPSFSAGTVQIFEWPSLNLISNLVFPLPIYSFDMTLSGSFLLTSTTTHYIYFYSTYQNWTDTSGNFYPAYLSDNYLVALSNGGSKIYVRNSTTGQQLFNITIGSTANWWARIINQKLYITSTSGLRQIDLSQGESASPVVLVADFSCKEMFLDASGRLYIEENNATKNNSFVYDVYGTLLASYTNGSKLIVKASKYTFYVLNNFANPLLFYQYP